MWKEGDRLQWGMENSLAHESTLHACVRPTLHPPANQLGSPAITHRYRGPPSFRERGLCYVAVSCQLAGPGGYHPPLARSPLFQRKRALLRCSLVPMSRTRRLSPTTGVVPPLSEKEGFVCALPFIFFPSACPTMHPRCPR